MSDSLQIAFICPRFPAGSTVGGAETLMKHLARLAVSAGHSVTFLTTCAENHVTWENTVSPGIQTVDGIEVHFFPVRENRNVAEYHRLQERISRGTVLSRDDQERWMNQCVNSDELIRFLVESGSRFDRILAGPYLFGLIYHAAQIFPERTWLVPCLHDEPFARQDVIRDLFAMVRGALFNTAAEKDLAHRLFDLAEDFGSVVGMGIELPESEDAPNPAASALNGEPYVLYSGRRETLKGTNLLAAYLDAFQSRTGRAFRWVVTGSGPIDLPSGLHDRVIDLGFVSEAEKVSVMRDAAVFIHPSINESLGIVLLEAWRVGTPGLVHAGSEVLRRHCEDSGGGLWFRFYPDFEEALSRMLDDSRLRQSMGDSGRDYVRRVYSPDAVRDRFDHALGGA